MLIFLCFTKTHMQEWNNLKIEELNRKQHVHLEIKAVLILHQWLLGCRSCLNAFPAPGPLTCSSQWQRPRDTGGIHPRDYKPHLVSLTSLTWVGKLIQIPKQEKTEAHWEVKDLHEVMGTELGQRSPVVQDPKASTEWEHKVRYPVGILYPGVLQ